MEKSDKTAFIIGAGPAGLTCAYTMLKTGGVKPVIFEKSGDIGGISRTHNHNGNRMDIGGHRFFSKNDEVNNIWLELMPMQGAPSPDQLLLDERPSLPSGGPDPQRADNVMLLRRRVSRIYYLRRFFDYPISLRAQTFINMGLVRTVKAGLGYLASAVKKRPERSLEDFYINRFGKALYSMFFEDYTEKVWGRHPRGISADWGRQRVKGLSLLSAVLNVLRKPFISKDKVETSLIEQFYYPKLGPGQLYERMAQRIIEMGGEIIKNCDITHIINDGERVSGVRGVIDGVEREFHGDFVVSSMPVKELVPALGCTDPTVCDIAARLPYRDFITVGLLVKKLLISNSTKLKTMGAIVPDCWIYLQEPDVKIGRLQIFNNWSPYMIAQPQDTVWLGLEYFCDEGDSLWEIPDKQFIKMAVDELASIGIISPQDVLDSVRLRVPKAYPAYFDSYAQFDTVQRCLDGFEGLYCIGRNGQHRYNNMDHSMLTGILAARHICGLPVDKSAIWQVNTEEDYHEGAK